MSQTDKASSRMSRDSLIVALLSPFIRFMHFLNGQETQITLIRDVASQKMELQLCRTCSEAQSEL